MNPAICNVYLEEAETDKTKIKIIVTNAYGAVSSNSILESILNDYLNLLAKVLKGDSIEAEKKKGHYAINCVNDNAKVKSIVKFKD